LSPEGLEGEPYKSQIKLYRRMSLFLSLQIFTNLPTKEFGIDTIGEDNKDNNPPQSRRPRCLHLLRTRQPRFRPHRTTPTPTPPTPALTPARQPTIYLFLHFVHV